MTDPFGREAPGRPRDTEPGGRLAVPADARLAVLGRPIAHSRSPRIHLAAYAVLGLGWGYEAIERSVPELADFLASRGPEWRGFSLTMPLKEEAHRLATVLDPVAARSGVVNTLLRLEGGWAEPKWAGFNTDVGGLAAAIRNAGLDVSHTIVLGSGATAVSAILAVQSLGAQHVEVVARNVTAISDLIARFGTAAGVAASGGAQVLHMSGTPLEHVDGLPLHRVPNPFNPAHEPTLVVSTLPGPAARAVGLPDALTRLPLFDVAYDPWPSPLAERWRAAGGVAHPGTDMLLEQAILQIRIFTSGNPELPLPEEERVREAMRRAV